ncbi:hypothetical protein NESM_000067400 [Novymonas esmeraldas]|uniref:Transmembrane protein n=1 Tax=Novymonas esmeraldas TaxID=1808958 RepID=A0AAW0F2R9_9TRYP
MPSRAAPPLALRPVVLAAALLVLCVLPALVTAAVSTRSGGGDARNPSVVPHLGDIVPLTLYMRVKRQVQHSFISIGAADAQLQVDEVAVEDGDGNDVDVAALAAKAQPLPKDLDLPSLGAARGKHPNQVDRVLPPSYCPRFGINRAVILKVNDTLRLAGEIMEADATLQQSDFAFRFSVGRGLQKESTWLPLAARKSFMNVLSATLAARLHAEQAAQVADTAAERQRGTLGAEDVDPVVAQEARRVQYLSRVTFFFGFRKGDLQKMTSFSITAQYSPEVKAGVEIQYVWNEHRAYNPNRAVTLCSAVVVLVSMITMLAVFHPSSRSMLLFSQRIVAARAHE